MRAEEEATAHLPVPEIPKHPVPPPPPMRVERRAYSRPSPLAQKPDPAKQARWPLGDARALLRDGYKLAQVMRMTGWPKEMLED